MLDSIPRTAIPFAALALFSFAMQRPARACGGLFCNGVNPIVQTGEQIVFSVDPAAETVEAIINIQYQGSPRDFAWILPLESAPSKVEVAPSTVFSASNNLTAPRFVMSLEEEGTCENREDGLTFPSSVRTAAESQNNSNNSGVNVIEERAIGPYQNAIIQASDVDAARMWLVERGYAVTDAMMQTVAPYIQKGDVLLALRLQNDQDVGDIQPIWVAMQAKNACVPIRLTAIAAVTDMEITALVLSNEGRAIPKNFFHAELNLARIDWWTQGANYRSVVAEAANEGSGHAFVTEFSGSARIFDGQIFQREVYNRDALAQTTTTREFADEVSRQGFLTKPEAAGILARLLPDEAFEGISRENFQACPSCWARSLRSVPLNPTEIVDELWSRLVEPERLAQELFDRNTYATRLYTLLSPEEMNVDPEFSFRPDLEPVSNVHRATAYRECGLGTERSQAPIRLEIEESGQVIRFESQSRTSNRVLLDSMPAATRIEQLQERALISDRTPEIDRTLAEHNALNGGGCGCNSAAVGPGSPTALLLLLLVALRRRA